DERARPIRPASGERRHGDRRGGVPREVDGVKPDGGAEQPVEGESRDHQRAVHVATQIRWPVGSGEGTPDARRARDQRVVHDDRHIVHGEPVPQSAEIDHDGAAGDGGVQVFGAPDILHLSVWTARQAARRTKRRPRERGRALYRRAPPRGLAHRDAAPARTARAARPARTGGAAARAPPAAGRSLYPRGRSGTLHEPRRGGGRRRTVSRRGRIRGAPRRYRPPRPAPPPPTSAPSTTPDGPRAA